MVGEKVPIKDTPKELVLPLEFPDHVAAARQYFSWSDEWRGEINNSQKTIDDEVNQTRKYARQLLVVGRTIQMVMDGVQGKGYDPLIAKYLGDLGYPDLKNIALVNPDGKWVGIDPKKLEDAPKVWLANVYQDLLRGKMIGGMSTLQEVDKVERMEETDEIYFAELAHRYGERMHVLKAFRSRMLANLPRINEGVDTWRKQWLKERGGEPIVLYRGQSLPNKDKEAYRHTLTAVGLRKGGLNPDEVELMSEELMKRNDVIDWAALALGHSSRSTVRNQEMVDPLLSCSASDLKAKQYGEVIRLKVPPEYVVPMAYIAERRVGEIELQMRRYTTNPDNQENRRLSAERGKWLQHLSNDEEYMVIGHVRPEWVIDADVREIIEGEES